MGTKIRFFLKLQNLRFNPIKIIRHQLRFGILIIAATGGMDLFEGTEAEALVDRHGIPDKKSWTRVIWHDCKRLTENYSLDQGCIRSYFRCFR